MDRHQRGNEKEFGIGKTVFVFHTQMGSMPGKLRFGWIDPFCVTKEFNGSYQLGTLSGELLIKWVNGFWLKPYKGRMPENPFIKLENPWNTESRTKIRDTSAKTKEEPEATDSEEPGITDK